MKSPVAFLVLTIVFIFPSPARPEAEVQVKVIRSESDLPEAFCPLWKPDDILISDGSTLVLVGGTARPLLSPMKYPAPNAMGSLLGFVPAGRKLEGTLNIGAPAFRIKGKTEWMTYAQAAPGRRADDGSPTIECAGVFEKPGWGRAAVKTTYAVPPGRGRVELVSVVTNTGLSELKDFGYSLAFSADHSYSFSPYHRDAFPKLNYRIFPRKGHYLSWHNPNPVDEGERRSPGTLKPGASFTVRYVLAVDRDHEPLLRELALTLDLETAEAILAFKNVEGPSLEVIVREFETGAVFFRTFLEEPFATKVTLPVGRYVLRANFFPAVRERNIVVKPGADNLVVVENSSLGALRVKIRDGRGEAVPGKVTFLGLDPTKSPYFRPENPRASGRAFETVKNSVYPPEAGLEVKLPVGHYLVFAARGPEYDRDIRAVEVLKDDLQSLVFTVDRIVRAPGFVSLDPHLHTIASDGHMSAAERLRSVVAEGLDVAVATDHNVIIDYAEPLQKLGYEKLLAVLPGYELTRSGVLHANVLPAARVEGHPQAGAVPVDPEDPATLFRLAREAHPGAVLMINHPRAGDLGYFNNFELDKETAEKASAGFDLSFDLFEGLNGPNFFRGNQEAVEDWLNLLNRGYYFPIIGSSDAHGIASGEPGYSRTYVAYEGGKGEAFDPAAFLRALKQGRSFATNGPLVDVRLNGKARPGETIRAEGGAVTMEIAVSGAPWVAVDEVRVIVNGERRVVFPVHDDGKAPERFRRVFSLVFDRDGAVVVEVLGRRSLYPVVQKPTVDGLAPNASLPYAITNPIFVDIDGNGRFDPLRPEKVRVPNPGRP